MKNISKNNTLVILGAAPYTEATAYEHLSFEDVVSFGASIRVSHCESVVVAKSETGDYVALRAEFHAGDTAVHPIEGEENVLGSGSTHQAALADAGYELV